MDFNIVLKQWISTLYWNSLGLAQMEEGNSSATVWVALRLTVVAGNQLRNRSIKTIVDRWGFANCFFMLIVYFFVILIEVFRCIFYDFTHGLGRWSCWENGFLPTIGKMGSAGQAHWLLKHAAWHGIRFAIGGMCCKRHLVSLEITSPWNTGFNSSLEKRPGAGQAPVISNDTAHWNMWEAYTEQV